MKASNTPTTLVRSAHGAKRQQQRGISTDLLHLTVRFGKRYRIGGGRVGYFLGRRHLPDGLLPALAECAEGLVVVLDGETVVTAYRNVRGFRATRKSFRRKGGSL